MDSHSQATHREDDDDEEAAKAADPPPATVTGTTTTISTTTTTTTTTIEYQNGVESEQVREDTETSQNGDSMKQEPIVSESEPTTSKTTPPEDNINNNNNNEQEIEEEEENEDDEDDEEEDEPPPKKQKQLSSITEQQEPLTTDNNNVNKVIKTPALAATTTKKKSKKKNNNNVWVTRSTRKGKKKTKPNPQNTPAQDTVLITPVPRFHDKTDDTPDMSICLSKVYKAEKVELSEDRLSAASAKGYRMVRATRGVCEGAWYFEIKVANLGETGHTRLGWSMEKGDLQAPVGYDANSFGYRDIDGSKVHKALREKYGEEGYKEGDVIGFYINLPDGSLYASKPPHLVWYKGQRYVCAPDSKEDPPKIIPESEMSFFKNGICQGVAFKDLFGGRYYPAASMYTLPNQPNCMVKFNFGPDFEFFPEDFGGRPIPRPMSEVPYHGFDSRVENDTSNEVKN